MDSVLSDWLFLACIGWTASNIAATHYLVIRFNWCASGRKLIGRYTMGVLSFGLPFAVWCLGSDVPAPLFAFAVLVAVAGFTTLLCYFGIDANVELNASRETLDEVL